MKTERRALFLGLILSFGNLIFFAPPCAAGYKVRYEFDMYRVAREWEEEKKKEKDPEATTPVVFYCPLEELNNDIDEGVRPRAELFARALVGADFEAGCKIIDAVNPDSDEGDTYLDVLTMLLEEDDEWFERSNVRVKLTEYLLDKGAIGGIDSSQDIIPLLDLALFRVLERHRHGIDNAAYKCLVKKLLSLHIPPWLYETSSILHFSLKDQWEALDLVDLTYRNTVEFHAGHAWNRFSRPSESRLIARMKAEQGWLQALHKKVRGLRVRMVAFCTLIWR
jgi:hypothetical protein